MKEGGTKHAWEVVTVAKSLLHSKHDFVNDRKKKITHPAKQLKHGPK